MIIRSQDKESIINIDNISHIYATKPLGESHGFHICASGYVLATYSTKEKAIKVLDMIEKKHTRYQCLKASGRLCEEDSIFQMPSDEEVEV